MRSARTGRNSDQCMVRLPDGMRGHLKQAAEENGRSMNAEIVSRLLAPPATSAGVKSGGQFKMDFGDNYDPDRIDAAVRTVRECRLLFGAESARSLWASIGLPTPTEGLAKTDPLGQEDVAPDPPWGSNLAAVREFLAKACRRSRGELTSSTELAAAYNRWAESNGAPIIHPIGVGKLFRRAGLRARKGSRVRYLDIALPGVR